MTEELFVNIFNYIYLPFGSALILICGFFWREHQKNKLAVAVELKAVDDRLDSTVTKDQVSAMIHEQTDLLKEVNINLIDLKITSARTDERVKSMEAIVERRSEIRANNS